MDWEVGGGREEANADGGEISVSFGFGDCGEGRPKMEEGDDE